MKKVFLVLVIVCVQNLLHAQSTRSNCQASPYPVTIVQNDGSVITYKVIGNEAVHYFETEDGYTILPNNKSILEYAVLNQNGDLVASGLKAFDVKPVTTQKSYSINKHLRYSQIQINDLKTGFALQNPADNTLYKAAGEFPSTGTNKVCVILMDFYDDAAAYPKANFENLLNQPKYQNTGSFKDAFMEYSAYKFTPECDVYGWFTASSPRLSYAKTNMDGTANSQYMTKVRQLVTEAINKADSAGVDFSQYDNDNDGDVDGLIIFQAGFGAEQGLNGYIWSHRSTISTVVKDGKTIRNYCINPSKRNWGGNTGMVGIGVASHEFGHIIGLPDLYDTQDKSEGHGNWGLMAGGGWLNSERSPCHFDPWSKVTMGWLTPTVINSTGTYTLYNSADSNTVYRVNTPSSSEYFLLENKQKRKFDAYVPGRGLAIWHINTAKTNLYPGSNTVNTDTARYGVGLMQADGLREMERNINRGNAGDLFPGSTNNRNFTPNSNPSSNLYTNAQGNRLPSNVSITSITQNADSTITFNLGNKSVSAFTPSTLTGCAPLTVTFNNVSAFANNFSWDFGNGEKSNVESPLPVTYTQTGNYTVKLYVLDSVNNKIDSSQQEISVKASPKAAITITRGDSNTFTLKHQSVGHLYIVWRFGSNQTSTAPEPIIKLTSGDLDIKLIAYNADQCSDTAFGVLNFWPVGVNEYSLINQVSVFPNPFSQNLNIGFNLKNAGNISITIIDVLGKSVKPVFAGNATAGNNSFNINTSDLNTGVYFVNILGNGFTKTIKILNANN